MNDHSRSKWTAPLTAMLFAGCLVTWSAPEAQAAAILTLDNTATTTSYQQTQSNPCIIADPSCSNPAGFSQTLIPAGPAGANYTLNSPTYTASQIRNLVGDQFVVAIDVNTTTQPLATERLINFSATIGSTLAYQYTGNVQFFLNANGNGWSDALLRSFDLTGIAGTTSIFFTATIADATDGREQFFLASGRPTTVPEPATLGLFGMALLGLGMLLRREHA